MAWYLCKLAAADVEKLAAGHWNVVDDCDDCDGRLMNKSSPTIAAGVANVKVDGVKYDADVDVDDEPLMVRTLPPKLVFIKSLVWSCEQLCPVPEFPYNECVVDDCGVINDDDVPANNESPDNVPWIESSWPLDIVINGDDDEDVIMMMILIKLLWIFNI